MSKLSTPILFLVFNRIETTKKVFSSIKKMKPPKLYISCDGPRDYIEGESAKVNVVREYIINNIDWDCKVATFFRDSNLGCKKAISTGIDWFFDNEEMGIILEDDCMPNEDFYHFCEYALSKYKDCNNIFAVTGNNFQDGNSRGDASYYFSKHMHVWGWASWRRAWKYYDVNISYWQNYKKSQQWNNNNKTFYEKKYWEVILDKVSLNKINTWDYQWNLAIWKNNGMVVTPNKNLVTNIGFGCDATHTTSKENKASMMRTYKLKNITEPSQILINMDADNYVFKNYIGGSNLFLVVTLFRLIKLKINRRLTMYYN